MGQLAPFCWVNLAPLALFQVESRRAALNGWIGAALAPAENDIVRAFLPCASGTARSDHKSAWQEKSDHARSRTANITDRAEFSTSTSTSTVYHCWNHTY
jgi:hypothetical protein